MLKVKHNLKKSKWGFWFAPGQMQIMGCRRSNLGLSIITLKNKAFAPAPFFAAPEPSAAPGQTPHLLSPFSDLRSPGGAVGCWGPGGGASGPSSQGEMLQGVSGLCSCDEGREKQGGGGRRLRGGFFFFFLLRSLPRARPLHSQSGCVLSRIAESRCSSPLVPVVLGAHLLAPLRLRGPRKAASRRE